MCLLSPTYSPNFKCQQYDRKELGEELESNGLTFKQAEDFSKVIDLLKSPDLKNKRLAIKLSRVIYRFDCYDLCQYLKKIAIMKGDYNSDFLQALEFVEYNIKGYRLENMSCDSKSNDYMMSMDITISLYNLHSYNMLELKIKDAIQDIFSDIFMSKKYKANPYRTLLLNYS